MAVDVETQIVIDRPIEEVAAYATDPSNAPAWYANIDSVDWKSPPPLVVGASIAFVARFLGRRIEYTYEIVELTGARLVMRTRQGPFPMETTYTWTVTERGATRMTLRNRGEPPAFSKMATPMIEAAMRRTNRKDLANIKHILEADQR